MFYLLILREKSILGMYQARDETESLGLGSFGLGLGGLSEALGLIYSLNLPHSDSSHF